MTLSGRYTKENLHELRFVPEAVFEECEFEGVDFSSLDLKSVSFLDCKFSSCNFANQAMRNTSMRDVTFSTCNLVGVNWCALKRLENPKFIDSKLNFSSFQGLKLKHLELINCSALEADFSEADLSHGVFSNTTFAGANLDKAILIGADFRSSREYIFDVRTAKIKGAKFAFPDVVSLITALGAEVELY